MEISQIGKEMLRFQEELARAHKYKPVPPDLFLGDVREKYRNALPGWCKEGSQPLCTLAGTPVVSGFDRIVIGDYGAFVEAAVAQIVAPLVVQRGEEYRINDPRFSERVKYIWLTVPDTSSIKVYLQKKTVEYADYVPGKYYFSVYEVIPAEKEKST